MVFQNYALYPHMTVADNIGFHLKIRSMPKAERAERVPEAAKLLDLEPLPRPQAGKPLRWPAPARRHGPRDRARAAGVLHGRAAVQPGRQAARADPRRRSPSLQRRLGVTTIYVTHDQVEAMTMGDRVAVLKDGLLQQCDTPIGLFDKPANLFVAGFIGSPAMNLIPATVGGEGARRRRPADRADRRAARPR